MVARDIREHYLELPAVEETLRSLKLGDVVYLTGILVTMRDRAHLRALEYLSKGQMLPFKLRGKAVYHCGPLAKYEAGRWRVLSAGPTTSLRLEGLMEKIIELLGVQVIVGKGGVGEGTRRALRGRGIYLAFPGGAGALAAKSIEEVEEVYWLDLGMAEAVWVLKVREFGPCIVAVDVKGNTLYKL